MTATDPLVAAPATEQAPAEPAEAPPVLAIADVAEQLGITAHTLRYYERIGLVTVPRDPAGRRRYGPEQVGRVVFITRLRMTAMPIRDIQAYFRLVDAGPGNEAQRLAVLERHRAEVVARLDGLQSALVAVDHKISLYRDAARPRC